MNEHKQRGGYRPNAHRPRLYNDEVMSRETIRLAKQHTRILQDIDPSISAAIRAILDDPRLAVEISIFIKKRKENKNVPG